MKRFVYLALLLFIVLLGSWVFLHKDVSDTPTYVTSETCKNCHQDNYSSWKKNTLHPYMFRPVKSEADLLGDFESDSPALTFKKEDVEFVVGNKWEQVYVRIIDGEYYPLPAKWHIILKKWEPYKVDSWHEVPMSKKCNGCHTTGFDPTTFEFSEFGIGCEACHGPGSLHVQNKQIFQNSSCSICHVGKQKTENDKTDIVNSVSPTVCGQCHNRGNNTPQDDIHGGIFDFPVKFKPGDDLDKALIPLTPKQDKKGKFWWGNGIAKNRHQEFGDWSKSKHANAVKKLKENYEEGGDRGKLDDRCLHCHSTDYRHAKPDAKPDLDNAKFGVTCVACHEPHGRDKEHPSHGDGMTLCGGCHAASMSHISAKKGKTHSPCPATVACADCHMPRIVKTGGFYSLRSHAFKIVPPNQSLETGMPNSCQNSGCHSDKNLDWAIKEFDHYYPDFKKK